MGAGMHTQALGCTHTHRVMGRTLEVLKVETEGDSMYMDTKKEMP